MHYQPEVASYLERMRAKIGLRQRAVVFDIEKGSLLRFMAATAQQDLCWEPQDPTRLVAPPTFVSTFATEDQFASIFDRPSPFSTILHSDDKVVFHRQIVCGDRLHCVCSLESMIEKQRNGSPMIFFRLLFEISTVEQHPVAEMWITQVSFQGADDND